MYFKYAVNCIVCISTLVFMPFIFSPPAVAKDAYKATTATNVDINIEDLSSLLLPLDQSELETEAQAWQSVLSQKVTQIARLEIQSRHANEQGPGLLDAVGEQLKDSVEAVLPVGATQVRDAVAKLSTQDENTDNTSGSAAGEEKESPVKDAEETDKTQAAAQRASELAALIADKRIEQGAINKRFAMVLDALESKGGDVKERRLYLNAVSGIKLDVDNTSAGLLAVKDWLKSQDGGLQLVINLLQFAAVILFVVFLSRMAGRITDRIVDRQPVSMLLENFMKVAIRRTVLAVGFIFSLPIIGIDVGPLLALIGAAGLVIGLALQGTLSNFASGVLILIYRPYDMNDAVTAGDVTGVVHSMNLLFTTIRTFDNQMITIPNNNIWNDAITNITGSHQRRVDLVFGIGYADDFAKAQDILRTILKEHPKVLEAPEANIRLHDLAESTVKVICRPWAKTEDYWDVYWDVMETAKREFDKQGISFPFPQRDVHFYPAVDLPDAAEKTA